MVDFPNGLFGVGLASRSIDGALLFPIHRRVAPGFGRLLSNAALLLCAFTAFALLVVGITRWMERRKVRLVA